MKAVHAAMGINDAEFTFFENALLTVLLKAGVTRPDVTAVKGVLETTRSAIVTAVAPPTGNVSICNKYSKALGVTNKALLQSLVTAIVGNLVAPTSIVKKYFDGTKPKGSTNFTDPANGALLKALVNSLMAFFYAPLGCTDQPPLKYAGGDMKTVHKSMGISLVEFQAFVAGAGNALTNAGVSAADLKTVAGVLNSFQRSIVKPRHSKGKKPKPTPRPHH